MSVLEARKVNLVGRVRMQKRVLIITVVCSGNKVMWSWRSLGSSSHLHQSHHLGWIMHLFMPLLPFLPFAYTVHLDCDILQGRDCACTAPTDSPRALQSLSQTMIFIKTLLWTNLHNTNCEISCSHVNAFADVLRFTMPKSDHMTRKSLGSTDP